MITQFKRIFKPDTTMTEIPVDGKKGGFVICIMEIHPIGGIDIEFDHTQCIITASRLPDRIGKVTRMKR